MKKVVVWGKFDVLHEGHLEFLRNAKLLGDELYVVVIPDYAVKQNSQKMPKRTAIQRKEELMKLYFIKEVYIDSLDDGLLSIIKLKPDIFIFGHDQKTIWEDKLKQYLALKNIKCEYLHLGVYNDGLHLQDFKER